MKNTIAPITDILIKDQWGNPGSAVIVNGNKASFHTESGFITRTIKNNKVQVKNIWYSLAFDFLIHKG